MYQLAGIDPKALNASQKEVIEQLFSRLLRKCNQNDASLESISDALKDVKITFEADPLFTD